MGVCLNIIWYIICGPSRIIQYYSYYHSLCYSRINSIDSMLI